jgi:hypothetical protein
MKLVLTNFAYHSHRAYVWQVRNEEDRKCTCNVLLRVGMLLSCTVHHPFIKRLVLRNSLS